MPLAPGTRLGPYEVTAQIGAGGMGEVYRARDAKLGRDVALKILPEAFVGDPDRVARFEREAQVVAALNHPNIAIIHGFQESDGVRALVLELVEGETLAEVIARGPLPLTEALAIARQIADALEAAHDKGIVHRDLKPDNVKVTSSGTIKVLDFGLAKMLEPDTTRTPSYAGTMSPTISLHATYGGIILGTPAYMSPEQARGKPVDRRVDIWAFGCVLFELLTGRKTFDPGETISDAVAHILTREPDWTALPADTPAHVHTLLRRCLQKDPQKRLPHIGLVRLELDEGDSHTHSAATATVAPLKSDTTSPARKRAALVAGALAAVGLGATLTWVMMRTPPVTRQTRFSVEAVRPISTNAFFRNIAISPDGTQLAYADFGGGSAQQLLLRRLDRLDTQTMRGITSAGGPFFSPDSRTIGFFAPASSELRKVSVDGGPAIPVCRFQGAPRGATWGTDDMIVFATNDQATGLLSVPAGGGEPKLLTKPDQKKGEQDHLFPSMLPGRRAVLFTVTPVGGLIENSLVAVLDLATGQTKTLIRGGSHGIYVDTGHLVYASAGSLRAVRFDLDRLTVFGDAIALVDQVRTLNSGAAQFDVSRSGTLVFMPGGEDGVASVARSLVWVDRSGREQPIGAAPRRSYAVLRLSPDGRRVAVDTRDQESDVWIWDVERETLTKLTTNPGVDALPIWTPDGAHIVFTSSRDGLAPNLFWQRADFTGTAERLATSANSQNPHSFTPDGKNLIVQMTVPGNSTDLHVMAMDALLSGKPATGKMETAPLLHTMAAEVAGEISPDGRWIAYYSNSSGRNDVYVRAFPNVEAGGQFPISTAGGTRPAWSRKGRELFYLDLDGAMMVVPVQTTPTFSAGKPAKLFDATWWTGQSVRTYDVTADGQRFLAIKDPMSSDSDATPQTFTVVLNWVQELKQKLP